MNQEQLLDDILERIRKETGGGEVLEEKAQLLILNIARALICPILIYASDEETADFVYDLIKTVSKKREELRGMN